jgi:hypothetical protein
MARIFQCGWELTSLTEVSATGGTPPSLVSGAGVPRSGTYALQTAATAGTSFARMHLAVGTDLAVLGHQSIWCQVMVLPSATIEILRMQNLVNDAQATVKQSSAGLLTLWDSNGSQITSVVGTTTAATIGVDGLYHHIEIKCDATTNPGAIALWVDGVLIASGANFNQGQYARLACGVINVATATYRWDDWIYNDGSGSDQTGRVGDDRIMHLQPNGTGTDNAWSNTSNAAGTTNNFTLVREVSPDSTGTYVQTGVAGTKDYYLVVDTGLSDADTITCVQAGCQLRNNVVDAAAAVRLGIKQFGGSPTLGTPVIPNTASFGLHTGAEPRLPSLTTYLAPDGSAWNRAKLDSCSVGLELSTANVNRIQVSTEWVSVAYILAVAPARAPQAVSQLGGFY